MKNVTIGVIGLGYVGLPLCISFSKKFNVIGFDINAQRIDQLKKFVDVTNEVSSIDLKKTKTVFTNSKSDLKKCNFYIITVPTPITKSKKPDFKPLISASEIVGSLLKKDDFVVYESTVYPGATEEICIPVLESTSKLKSKEDFFYGYSPERINPGDRKRTLEKITKITSGCTNKSAEIIDNVYKKIIKAGTHKCSSVKIAEAAKVIENTQRDVNIALINELSIIFSKEEINTLEVLEAAGTKWNFLDFRPGLVGGHCIGVDPYYLTSRAQMLGYEPDLVLAGRKLNDGMGKFISKQIFKKTNNIRNNKNKRALIMGITFKENCPDVRNTKVIDIYDELSKKFKVDVYDPVADKNLIKKTFNISTIDKISFNNYDAIIIAVAHNHFKKIPVKDLIKMGSKDCVFFDIKGIFKKHSRITQL